MQVMTCHIWSCLGRWLGSRYKRKFRHNNVVVCEWVDITAPLDGGRGTNIWGRGVYFEKGGQKRVKESMVTMMTSCAGFSGRPSLTLRGDCGNVNSWLWLLFQKCKVVFVFESLN
jgi:hypothetical protein